MLLRAFINAEDGTNQSTHTNIQQPPPRHALGLSLQPPLNPKQQVLMHFFCDYHLPPVSRYFYSAVLLACLAPSHVHESCISILNASGSLSGCPVPTMVVPFRPLVSPRGYGVSHSRCWDRLLENSRYSNYILCLSSLRPAPTTWYQAQLR